MTTEQEIAGLVREFFEAVSFEAGSRPRYEAIAGLFVESGLLINTAGEAPDMSTVEQFIAPRQAAVDAGSLTQFREVETGAETRWYGNVAHRFSDYRKSGVRDGVAFSVAGKISTQFVRMPYGWRISVMAWDDER